MRQPVGKFLHVLPARLRDTPLLLAVQPGFIADRREQVADHLPRRFLGRAILEAVDELAELQQRPELARLHAMGEAFFEGGGEQRQMPLASVLAERLQCRTADAALGRGDGTDEGRVVVAVRQQAQVRGDVLDFGLVEEGLAAREQVGNPVIAQVLFQRARLEVATVENRVIGEFRAVLELVRLQFHHHLLRFLLVVLACRHADRVALAEVGPQFLVEQFFVVRDQRVRRLENAHRRAVILFELDQLELRVVARQSTQVLDIGAAPAVDRLVVVADRGECRARPCQQLEQVVLAGVGVLVLVDQQVAQAVLPLVEHLLLRAEQFNRQGNQIVEVDGLIGFERRRVAGVGLRRQLLGVVLRILQRLVRRDQRVLPVGDQRLQAADRRLVDAAREVGNDPEAVSRVEDRKLRLVAKRLSFFAQNAHTERVEGRNRQPSRLRLEQRGNPFLHLARSLVGESDRGDVAGVETAVVDEIRDLLGDHARLAGTGAGEDQQGAVEVTDGFALGRIQ